MKNKKVLVLNSTHDSYEGLYVDGKCVDQYEHLEQGEERLTYFIGMSDKYNFDLRDVEFKWLTDEDENKLCEIGFLPSDINKLNGGY